MWGRTTCSAWLIPLGILIQLLLLTGEFIILRAGTGSIDDQNHLPKFSGLNLVVIDASEYTTTTNGETFHGLPDSHDFSKNKDVFGFYVGNYCSGHKVGGLLEADYCSPWGRQFFDLHRLWRIWGVDLIQENLIGAAPKLIYIGVVTTFAATVLCTVTLLFSFCSYWGFLIAAVLSLVTTIAGIITSALSHYFAQRLCSRAPNLTITGTGKLVVHMGYTINRAMLIGCVLTTICSIICWFVFWRKRRSCGTTKHNKQELKDSAHIPFLSVVSRATGGNLRAEKTSKSTYVQIEEVGVELHAPDADFISRSRAGSKVCSAYNSRDLSRSRGMISSGEAMYYGGGSGLDGSDNMAYEPFRHVER